MEGRKDSCGFSGNLCPSPVYVHPHYCEQEVDRFRERTCLRTNLSAQFWEQGKRQASFRRDLTWASKIASKRHPLKWVWRGRTRRRAELESGERGPIVIALLDLASEAAHHQACSRLP